MAKFEGQERRMPKIEACLAENGFKSLEDARDLCAQKGIDVEKIVKGVQPIAFENAVWAYTLGVALALKKGCAKAADAAEVIGQGLQAFCIPGSVAEQRQVGLGHGNLGAMLLRDETKCFCFLAGHESFAAAEGAIGIARNADKSRKEPLRIILNGLGKDAAYIISRINGFTYVETDYDFATGDLKVVREVKFSDGERSKVRCYGANDVLEGVAIMKMEKVDVSITGNYSADEAKAFQAVLESGSLPVNFEFSTSQVVGPTLGQDALYAGLIVVLIGLALVMLYLLFFFQRG